MSAITELQREIRERLDSAMSVRVTYSCGHTVLHIGLRPGGVFGKCTVCRHGDVRVVFKP